jgi:hypothetical protein
MRRTAEVMRMVMGAGLVLGKHGVGVGLAFGCVRRSNAIDDGLGFLVSNLLIIVDDVTQVIATAVMRLAHTHRVMCQVHIAIIAED